MGLFNKKPKIVTCNDCKCLVEKDNAQEVVVNFSDFGLFTRRINSEYYCNKCKKPYNIITVNFFRRTYFKEMEVDQNGEPIGYKKVK